MGERLNDGTRDGFGREILGNHDQYEGEYHQGLRNGDGTYMYNSGAIYNGEWNEDMKHGYGEFTYPDGSKYVGDWQYNMKEGFGIYVYANGDVFEGSWKSDVRHGFGNYTFRSTGTAVVGTWINDQLMGSMAVHYPHCEYHGYYNCTHPVGEGVYTFQNNNMLVGHVERHPGVHPNYSPMNQLAQQFQCVPRFIAHQAMPYDYSRLPLHPLPLPESDSNAIPPCSPNSSNFNFNSAHHYNRSEHHDIEEGAEHDVY